MKTNYIEMNCKLPEWETSRVVHVYDFIHDISETFYSFALCWCPWNETWLTTAVACLSPIKTTIKILKEDN